MSRGLWLVLYSLSLYAQPSIPKLRLPDAVHPLKYSVDLKLAPGEDSFEGNIDIDLDVRQAASTIWLHANGLQFRDVRVHTNGKDVAATAEPHENDLVGLRPESAVPPGKASLHISYSGQVSRILTDGLFQQKSGGDWYLF